MFRYSEPSSEHSKLGGSASMNDPPRTLHRSASPPPPSHESSHSETFPLRSYTCSYPATDDWQSRSVPTSTVPAPDLPALHAYCSNVAPCGKAPCPLALQALHGWHAPSQSRSLSCSSSRNSCLGNHPGGRLGIRSVQLPVVCSDRYPVVPLCFALVSTASWSLDKRSDPPYVVRRAMTHAAQ